MQSAPTPAPAAPAAPKVDLSTGKDLTSLNDADLLGELGFDPAPSGAEATSEPAPVDIENEIVQSVVQPNDPQPAATGGEPNADEAVEVEEPADPQAATTPNEPAPAKQYAAEFQAFDNEGELEIPDNLLISFKADGGKQFSKVPLDKVVRLAQQGVYNHGLQQEAQASREKDATISSLQEELATERAATERTRALAERLLTDDTFFEKALGEYQEYNSPEAQLARLQAENQALRDNKSKPAVKSDVDQANEFFAAKAQPILSTIAQQFSSVTPEELIGRFMLLTAPLQVNGKVPPAKFALVERILVNELAPWAQNVHDTRAASVAERLKQERQHAKAKVDSANTKRQLARAVRPAGRPAADVPASRPVSTADDAVASIMADLIARPTA